MTEATLSFQQWPPWRLCRHVPCSQTLQIKRYCSGNEIILKRKEMMRLVLGATYCRWVKPCSVKSRQSARGTDTMLFPLHSQTRFLQSFSQLLLYHILGSWPGFERKRHPSLSLMITTSDRETPQQYSRLYCRLHLYSPHLSHRFPKKQKKQSTIESNRESVE